MVSENLGLYALAGLAAAEYTGVTDFTGAGGGEGGGGGESPGGVSVDLSGLDLPSPAAPDLSGLADALSGGVGIPEVQVPEVPEPDVIEVPTVTDTLGDATDGVRDTLGDATDGVRDTLGDATDGVTVPQTGDGNDTGPLGTGPWINLTGDENTIQETGITGDPNTQVGVDAGQLGSDLGGGVVNFASGFGGAFGQPLIDAGEGYNEQIRDPVIDRAKELASGGLTGDEDTSVNLPGSEVASDFMDETVDAWTQPTKPQSGPQHGRGEVSDSDPRLASNISKTVEEKTPTDNGPESPDPNTDTNRTGRAGAYLKDKYDL